MAGENDNVTAELHAVRNIKTSFLDLFGKLTLDKEKLRLKGGVALVKYIARNTTGTKDAPELKYALTRLIRGLGASDNEIKQRYFSVLVALLSFAPKIKAQDILEVVAKELSFSPSSSKSVNADAAFGQVLSCGALIRAKAHGEETRILEMILSAGKKRSYLYLAALTFILELCDDIGEDEFKKVIWPVVKSELPLALEDQSLDLLYFLLRLKRKYPRKLKRHEVVSEQSLPTLATVLMNIPGVSSANHPVYALVAEELAQTPFTKRFLNEIDSKVDSFNYNRHLVITKILSGLFASLKGDVLPDLLTEKYMLHSVAHLKKCQWKDDDLQEGLRTLFDLIVEAQKRTAQSSIDVLQRFLFHPMVSAIDRTARALVAGLNEDGVKLLAELCRDVLVGNDETWTNNNKVYASKLLGRLLGHPRMHKELQWKTEQLKFLMQLALLKNQFSSELSGLLRVTFFQALDLKLPRLEDLRSVLSELVHQIEALQRNDDVFRRALNPVALETWLKTTAIVHKLERKSKIKHVTLVFLVLFLHMSLQLFNEVKLANDSLRELAQCYERIKSKDSEDIPWIEVVVDLFLSLLSHNSHLLRSLIRSVFPHLCKYMNATALHQILFVLDPTKEDNPLSPATEDLDEPGDETSSTSSDSQSEPEDDNDEQETINDSLRTALQAALNTTTNGDEEMSVDLDEMSDAEGKRLDEALAVAFKQFKPNLDAKKDRKEKEVLTHFRLRVLDLVDVYLDSGPSMQLCLEMMNPLLRLQEFCAKESPLGNKVRSTLMKLCALRKLEGDLNELELCGGLLKDLVGGREGAASATVAECCGFIVRCATSVSNSKKLSDDINEVMVGVLQRFISAKHSALSHLLIKKMLQSTWSGNMALVTALVDHSFEPKTRMFKRIRALELLKVFYSNRRALLQNAELFERDLRECEGKFLEHAVSFLSDPTSDCAGAYVRSLLDVLSEVKKRNSAPSERWAEVADCLRQHGSGLTISQDAKGAFRTLCKHLGLKDVVKVERRKPIKTEATSSGNEQRTKRKAGDPEERKNKKQRRMMAMSEGMATFHFSDALKDETQDED